ncbi:MAG: tetratricopeptide repeat protein [Eubacterium sp.]|nr:tetratricopeptide repeat protein [Eubacterium sp.]
MICYNCGSVLTNSDFCGNCGMDVSVYKRIVRLSNTYYNAGLTKAKNRDLSGAVDSLRRSVKLNKRNIDARNLLGLVYFEMGETVQAFSEWVMSTNIQPDNNPADKYLLAIQQEKSKVDELNRTIKKFNVALNYAKHDTDDMAIIQLKKVLNQNPKLVKASQLLCLLYMKQGQYERAKRTIKKSLKVDKCNPLSIRYLREINEYMDEERKNDPETRMERRRNLRGVLVDREYLSGNDVIIPNNNFKEAVSGAQGILHLIIGLLIGAALVYFIVTPARMSKITEDKNEAAVEYKREIAIKDSTYDSLESEYNALKKDYDVLADEKGSADEHQKTVDNNYKYLLAAVQSYLNNNTDKSVEALNKINTKDGMDMENFKAVYDKLTKELSSKMASNAYDEGFSAYENQEYDKAIAAFKKCVEIDKSNDDAYYYMAWAYKNSGDEKNAKKIFKKIVTDFPNSEHYSVAKAQSSDGEVSEDSGDEDSGDYSDEYSGEEEEAFGDGE